MVQFGLVLVALHFLSSQVVVESCNSVKEELKLPRKLKTRGKPKFGRWEDIDKTLAELTKSADGFDCQLTFGDVFSPSKDMVYFPLTNSVIRIAPEDSFHGLPVVTKEGEVLGTYEAQVKYERSGNLYVRDSYTLYFFQYRTEGGQIQAVGNRLLLGDFAVPWEQIKEKPVIGTASDQASGKEQ